MGMQLDWRFCEKCHVMFFDGFPQKGNCAAGGPHVAQGFMFALPHDIPPVPQSQNAWRYCQNCHSMFYDGFPQKGLCPSNGLGHVAQGFMFVLPHDVPTQLDFNFAPIVFSAGIAAGGNAHLTLRQDGSYEFSGHFHDSGGAAYNTALAYVVKDLVNQAYSFKHSGHIAGTFESGSRDDDWDPKAVNTAIADNWANIAGSQVWRAQANVNVDLGSLLQTAVQAVGTVVDVVEVVSSVLA